MGGEESRAWGDSASVPAIPWTAGRGLSRVAAREHPSTAKLDERLDHGEHPTVRQLRLHFAPEILPTPGALEARRADLDGADLPPGDSRLSALSLVVAQHHFAAQFGSQSQDNLHVLPGNADKNSEPMWMPEPWHIKRCSMLARGPIRKMELRS